MSGGSYDYLFGATSLDELVDKRHALREMADRLSRLDEAEFPGATAVARSTQRLVYQLDLWDAHVEAQAGLLSGVWHAVEWWDSNDYSASQVVDELAKLLEPTPPPADADVVLSIPEEWKAKPLELADAPSDARLRPPAGAPAPAHERPPFRDSHRDPWPTDDDAAGD